ncbi:TPA: DNA mismatch repair protein MutT [Candidatus Uhrbacteria bacterium]|uniref:MutT/nudix family protein n=2 Tax=Candidatus Uhriibacteriota TaxID=1752732 RepID=A0A0G1SEQ0_9BACT|nr:MAG: MutT/nudix family protein [Candidatus Uhrbacteria bacterium GW2011_GWF2_46_218]KKU40558.1 MAG: MutT/nudix family protein [Candidatus Uhrbacteria bacterium GW2011_GWE2_46_68]HBK33402.1 DNA mismatch repair protein MutT [Candidatus Uhrbacteria bacterium]HCB18814.1 DNA mismatch repair protein MutT [Candidatus Uhrbacteria bacterium]
MSDIYQTFHVGINVFVIKDNHLLLGKRRDVYGDGTWGLPGGHLETGEALIDAAARELMEETGLYAASFAFSNLVNNRNSNKPYLQIGFIAQEVRGEPENKEPDRCEAWQWFPFDHLPDDLFPPHIKQIENFLQQSIFADS